MENQNDIKLSRKEKRALKKKNKNTNDRKGILLVVVLAIITAALFYNGIKDNNEPASDKLVINYNGPVFNFGLMTPQQTLPEVTQPIIENITTTVPEVTQPTTTPTEPEKDNGELSKTEILKKVGEGVNYIKDLKGTVKATKTQNMVLTLTECSLPAFVGVVNKVLDFFDGETVTEYTFTDGKTTDDKGNEMTFYGVIPPSNRYFELTEEGMADAYVTNDGENTTYTIVVVPETSTMADPRPPFHSMAGDTFDCTKVELPFGEITKADFDYPGSEIRVTFAPDGKVIRYHQTLRINGVGGGAAFGMSADGRIEGQVDEIWELTY